MKIPVIYAYPRSGGTLVNRCLGSISGNLNLIRSQSSSRRQSYCLLSTALAQDFN